MKTKEEVIAEFQADRQWLTQRIMSYYCDLMPMTGREFLIAVMNLMVSEEGLSKFDGCPIECAEYLRDNTPLSTRKVGAFDEAQRQIKRRLNNGDFSAVGGNALEREYQRQLNG